MIHIGVIGYGYWGPNIVRNFSRIPNATITWVCDVNPKTLLEIPKIYPTIKTTSNIHDVLNDPITQGVVIVTPPKTHYSLASAFLKKGKHVLVEKPMTPTVSEAKKLITMAKKNKKTLMVDHTFIYTPAIRRLKSIISSGTLGHIYYVDSVRTNLGLLQKDSNVVYDLSTHDFSIMEYLFGVMPKTISATGITQKDINQETVAFISVTYPGNLFLHCQVSWLSPMKIRRMMFIGTKKMLVYDDMEPSEKIKIYDKGISFTKDPKQALQLRIGYRSGNIITPHIPLEEGLYNMAKEFIRSINTNKPPVTDGESGLRVVRCLELATKSLRTKGKRISIQ